MCRSHAVGCSCASQNGRPCSQHRTQYGLHVRVKGRSHLLLWAAAIASLVATCKQHNTSRSDPNSCNSCSDLLGIEKSLPDILTHHMPLQCSLLLASVHEPQQQHLSGSTKGRQPLPTEVLGCTCITLLKGAGPGSITGQALSMGQWQRQVA